MKKRFPALFLALALCMGLAVPAFAADSSCSVRFQAPLETPEKQTFTFTDTSIGIKDSFYKFSYLGTYECTVDVLPTPRSANIIVSGLGASESIKVLATSKGSDGETYYQRAHSTEDGRRTYIPLPISEDASDYPVYDPAKPDASLSNTARLEELGFDTTRDEDGSVTIPASRLYELYGAGSVIVLYDASALQIAALLLSEEDTPAFTDLLPWCDDEAVWAAQRKITNGYGAKDKFAPGVTCTQAQILTFLWRAKDKPQAAKAPITTAASYQGAIDWAYEEKMIDDSFNSDAPCTRAQAVTFIWKARGELEAKEAASFSDVDAGSPIAPAVSWAVEKGVTKGSGNGDGTFAPDRVCTRGEIACFLYRAYN